MPLVRIEMSPARLPSQAESASPSRSNRESEQASDGLSAMSSVYRGLRCCRYRKLDSNIKPCGRRVVPFRSLGSSGPRPPRGRVWIIAKFGFFIRHQGACTKMAKE